MSMTRLLLAALACSALAPAAPPALAQAPLPSTPRDTVTDTYFDVKVPDPYRWLENGADPKVKAWIAAENAHARAYLDALPVRATIHDKLKKLISATSPSYYGLYPAGGKIFAYFNQPPKQQPMIAVLGADADPAAARVVVDPNAINAKGTTAIDWWVPSPDGSKLIVSLSENGSEDGTLHVFDAATGQDSGLAIPRVQYPTGGGSAAWKHDGSGFYYTRYPGPEDGAEKQHFYQRVFYHALGTDPRRDRYVAGRDLPKVAEIMLDNRQSPGATLMSVAYGDGGKFAQYVIGENGKVTKLAGFDDEIVSGMIGPDGTVYLVSRDDAPRGKLLALKPSDLVLAHARTLVPQGDVVLRGGGEFGGEPVTVTDKALYVPEIAAGPSRVAIYSHDGKPMGNLPLPDLATVSEVDAIGGGQVLYDITTYVRPAYFARYDEATGKHKETKLAETSPVSFNDVKVSRVFATSRDGTRVPLNIIAPKSATQDGQNPTRLYGYGGFGVSETPFFLGASGRIFLDGKGVLAFANIRGGGEYGETWHQQGMLTKKQNVFDDFNACADYLIESQWTTPDKLAAVGGSNGGLLMGAMITQHPHTFHAIVSGVGIYDMLRLEQDSNGAFNTTEYGTVKDEIQFRALYAYSPYHHVVKGGAYPAILMQTGENDGRVNPMQSRKMIAALQAADSSTLPVLLTVNHAGHGIGSSLDERVDQLSDSMAFLFDQLGMELGK
jgi:prolyl oligopeptidase